jgi:DNA polymerase-3 subunit alpha
MAEMECVVFAKLFAENAHLIRTDGAVWVSGTISLREDEPPKLLVNRMEELVEDSRFRPENFKAPVTNAKAQMQPMQEKNASAQMSQETAQEQVREVKKTESAPRRLFLRVPSQRDRLYLKALNLTELFDGDFPAYFYFADEKRYEVEAHGIYMDDYILSQLRQLLGEENVILK